MREPLHEESPDTPYAEAEKTQREHYDRILSAYEAHYDEPNTRLYRERFVNGPMFGGLEMRGKHVLEAMCGSGLTTATLLAQGAHVVGLDISAACIQSFQKRWPQCHAVCTSIKRSGLARDAFSVVVIVGGLHHLQPDVEPAIEEIHRLLEPGGTLCFFEPHVGSLPDWFRTLWYKHDSMFAPNEAAIDLESLKRKFADRFEFVGEKYGGNVGHVLVHNSMALRLPLRWKPIYTPLALRIEAALDPLMGRRLSCFVICQWKKRGAAPAPRTTSEAVDVIRAPPPSGVEEHG